MKVRMGFVSNSSSSSFCIYGTSVEADEIEKVVKRLSSKKEEKVEDDEDDFYNDREDFYKIAEEAGLEYHSIMGECHFVGKSWSEIGDNQTGKEFKKDVEEKMKKLFGKKMDCGTEQEAWRDG